jgi:hypothetical protein
MTDNHNNTMQNNQTPTEGMSSDQTGNESSLDGAACYALFEQWKREMTDDYKKQGNHPENVRTGWDKRQRGKIDLLDSVLYQMRRHSLHNDSAVAGRGEADHETTS